MDLKFIKQVFDIFKVSPNRLMELMSSLQNKELLKTRFLMDEIISEYRDINPIDTIILTTDDITKHNTIVENIKNMENAYSDFMLLLEENNLIEA